MCACARVVKACCLLQRMRSFFFISVRERSCALRGAGERTWARAAYLCFYELLKIRLAWSNLLSPGLLAHRCRRRREKRGWLKSLLSRMCDQWQAVLPPPPPPPLHRLSLSIQSSVGNHPSTSPPSTSVSYRKTLRCSKTWSCLIHTPLLEKAMSIASVFLFDSVYSQSNTSSCALNTWWGKICRVWEEKHILDQ